MLFTAAYCIFNLHSLWRTRVVCLRQLPYSTCIVCLSTIRQLKINFFLFLGKVFLDFDWPPRDDFSPKTMSRLHMLWWVWMTRFLDLFDTIFFVLRKKYTQISFLHLYHHTAVPILGWMCFKVNPIAPVILYFLLFNTFVHTVMYSYYALASFGPRIQR